MADADFYPQWDNCTLNYDLTKYNFPTLVLHVVKEIFPQVDALETIHKHLSPSQVVDLCDHVQKSFGRKHFMQLFDEFAEQYIQPKLNGKRYLIKRNPTLNCVIPDQQKYGRRLPFHQGIFYSNGRGMATMWMPLTKTSGTNSMYIAGLQDSRQLTLSVIQEKMSQETFEKHCLEISAPVEKVPGQVHLFTQEHIHGNVNNTTSQTRCAVDWHVLVENEEYGMREPGGFFRLPGDHEQSDSQDYSNMIFIAYVGNNTRYDKHIPMHFQRKMINDYCADRGIKHTGFIFENEFLNWLPILKEKILEKPAGIVMLSIHSLPNDKTTANDILHTALDNDVQLHFANELCSLKSQNDLERIETYLSFAVKQKGNYPWQA